MSVCNKYKIQFKVFEDHSLTDHTSSPLHLRGETKVSKEKEKGQNKGQN